MYIKILFGLNIFLSSFIKSMFNKFSFINKENSQIHKSIFNNLIIVDLSDLGTKNSYSKLSLNNGI